MKVQADFQQARATTTAVPVLSVFSYLITLLESIPRKRKGETGGVKDCYPTHELKENEFTR